jgi:hypothetical protein
MTNYLDAWEKLKKMIRTKDIISYSVGLYVFRTILKEKKL